MGNAAETANLLNNKAVRNLAFVAKETDATLIHASTGYVFKGDRNILFRQEWEASFIVRSDKVDERT